MPRDDKAQRPRMSAAPWLYSIWFFITIVANAGLIAEGHGTLPDLIGAVAINTSLLVWTVYLGTATILRRLWLMHAQQAEASQIMIEELRRARGALETIVHMYQHPPEGA